MNNVTYRQSGRSHDAVVADWILSVTLASCRDPQTVLIIVAVETGQAQNLSSFLGVGLLLH